MIPYLLGVSPDQTHVTQVPVVPTLSAQRTDKETLCAHVCQDTSLSLIPSQVSSNYQALECLHLLLYRLQ